MRRFLLWALAGLVCSAALRGFAWSGAGHMLIAAGAYRELAEAERAKTDAILKSHPEYTNWVGSFKGETAGMDLGLFVFMQASKWPDEIRRKHGEYGHPHWHYVNYPAKPPDFPMEAEPAPKDDILYGLREAERAIVDKSATAESRAAYLSWLIHLVGDLHQPLHCATLVNDDYPRGDKGGNDFYVAPASKGIRLHAFWDGLLGTRNDARSQANYAARLLEEHPRKSFGELKRKKFGEWSLEGRALAVDKAYLRGALKGSVSAEGAPPLPEGYSKEAKAIAEKQAALAIYRLADEVRKVVR